MRAGSHYFPGFAAVMVVAALASPASAADADLDQFKAQVEARFGGLAAATDGALEWVGADPFEIRRDGDGLVAVVKDGKLMLHADEDVQIGFDRLEIRQTGQSGGGAPVGLAILLPNQVTFRGAGGEVTKLAIDKGRASALLDQPSGRIRDASLDAAGAHASQGDGGASIDIGPLTISSKLVAEAGGGWSAPFDLELKKAAFSIPQAGSGTIERIAVTGRSAGPKIEKLEKLRDDLDAVQNGAQLSPEARLAKLRSILPTIPSVFGTIGGEAALDGLKVVDPAGERLVAVAKVEMMAQATGFDGDKGAIRLTIRQDGLDLAPALLDPRQVPRRIVVDLGVEDLKTEAVRALLRAAGEAGGADEAEREQAGRQMLGALAGLEPTFRVYDVALDTKDAGADLTGEAKGSPLGPSGYTAGGDLVVRGFDAISGLGLDPLTEYLPLLKEMAVEDKASDGTPRVKYRLASSPEKWATVNGNDVSLWFADDDAGPGRPRLLKPAEPPMQGPDVKSVQRALAAARIAVAEDGVYRPATAAAVARFQKQKGVNVSGVVDDKTRQLLGLAGPAPRRGGRN